MASTQQDDQTSSASVWAPRLRKLGWADLGAVAAWTAVVAAFFWDVVALQSALFYFDISEINLPYRDFLANELKAGRFSRWMPGLYCGLPLFSESQAGYLHPLKYIFYPFMEPWRAFGLDTVASIWLTGLAAFGWLRRHLGTLGALTGAVLFGLSGFVWAHWLHTSMINALISVPLTIWALEWAWDGGGWRVVVVGALAMACQVFAGHLQDFLLTALLVGLYGLYRAATERRRSARIAVLGQAVLLVGLAALLSSVQWVPSKELLDRSPRAGGLTWGELTYGSWSPELLPTLLVREAYGTRARDTDWMDGFYPYHEMNTSLGVLGIALAVVGAAGYRDRWVAFWVLLVPLSVLLMMGRFTALMDYAHRLPILGSSRIPVRFHLWMAMAVAALAGVGVDRLVRPGSVRVRLRWAYGVIGLLVLLSVPILNYVYEPAWAEPNRWNDPARRARSVWLAREWIVASARVATLTALGFLAMATAARSTGRLRALSASALPALLAAELLGAHWYDVPTIDPSYWTEPPASARFIHSDPDHQRVAGYARFSAGEPGYASIEVDFFKVRDTLAWSLPPIFGLDSILGETPMIPRRWKDFMDAAAGTRAQLRVAGASHLLSGLPGRVPTWPEPVRIGTAYISSSPERVPRARLMGRPVYARDREEAIALVERLGESIAERLVVEDPERPLRAETAPTGRAAIIEEQPERLVVEVETDQDAYVVISDTFDPGWSVTVDGQPASIRPAYVNFRAVFVEAGRHRLVYRYTPAGFRAGLVASCLGALVSLGLWWRGPRLPRLRPAHEPLGWPNGWPWWVVAAAVALVAASAVGSSDTGLAAHSRWDHGFHRFTWGAGIEAMRRSPKLD